MAAYNKTVRKFAKVLKPYGLIVENHHPHRCIRNREGKIIYHFSNSPGDSYFLVNSLKDLIKMGVVPEEARKWLRTLIA